MESFCLFENGAIADVFYECSALNGVKRVADTVAEDLFLVTGKKPNVISRLEDCQGGHAIIVATIGHSALIHSLAESGLLNAEDIIGKRECYLMKFVEMPFSEFPQIKQALLIVGSDKRGTIYGMFRLSELCGVSPLVFWGDAVPAKKEKIQIAFDNEILTKEPSVTYRGFFINDEWPAFGNWCTERYGGVNANAYEKVFELVLRLKGNYLWPAMWNSSFWEDGPDGENARLADEYGVIMGTSHHEPLCRAGIEWQNQYQKYGTDNTWSFVANSDAITAFWKEGIQRSKGLENVVTIGMRGESDSLLMGKDATLQDNINVLKKAITVQNQLIKDHINANLKEVPRMLAIYKEVEDFYFGTADCEGLRNWSEIEDVILLLSDDNYGNLRAIPQPTDHPHGGGYGIYYHFDYHGAPYSYEWLNGTNLVKAWEQLTMAYEHGIREMWIVNVGDIKGKEYPLSFFMDLAFDFEKWRTSHLNSAADYTRQWIDTQFGNAVSDEQKIQIHAILDGYTQWSTTRIPESLHAEVFQNNFHEFENTHEAVISMMSKAEALRKELPQQYLPAFESMIYFPVMAFGNSMLINLEAGINHVHAGRGTLIANQYESSIQERISLDRYYVDEFHQFLNGKWNHMMSSAHMGFRTWDDNNWTYPTIHNVCPIPYTKIIVSFRGDNAYHLGYHWLDKTLVCNAEMTRPDRNKIVMDIDSRGGVDFNFTISCDKPWLSFSQTQGEARLKDQPRTSIEIYCDRGQLTGADMAMIQIDFTFENGEQKQAFVNVKAGNKDYSCYPGTFIASQDYVCISAKNYVAKADIEGMGWRVVPRLGRTGDAIKSFPVTKNWENENSRPYVQYNFIMEQGQDQEYVLSFYFSPRNPMIKGGTIKGCFSINDNQPELFDIVPTNYYAEWVNDEWSYGVTNNIRIVNMTISLREGFNSLKFYAVDPNAILEDIIIYPKDTPIPVTHLAPPESYCIPLESRV